MPELRIVPNDGKLQHTEDRNSRTTSRRRRAEPLRLLRSAHIDTKFLRHSNKTPAPVTRANPNIHPTLPPRLLNLLLIPILLARTFNIDSLQAIFFCSLEVVQMRRYHGTLIGRQLQLFCSPEVYARRRLVGTKELCREQVSEWYSAVGTQVPEKTEIAV
jgi:hypothetical protein